MVTPTLGVDRVPAVSGIRVRLEPVVDLDWLGQAWRALEPQSEPSFFRSWGWIGCWLQHLPPDRQPLAAIATKGDQVLGLGVFLARRKWRHGLMPIDSLGLHQSGEAALDSLHIEHNGVLAARSHAPAVWQAMLSLLTCRSSWHELTLGGLERSTAALCIEAACAHQRCVIVRERRRSAHLDLTQLRRSGSGLAHVLSRNTR